MLLYDYGYDYGHKLFPHAPATSYNKEQGWSEHDFEVPLEPEKALVDQNKSQSTIKKLCSLAETSLVGQRQHANRWHAGSFELLTLIKIVYRLVGL